MRLDRRFRRRGSTRGRPKIPSASYAVGIANAGDRRASRCARAASRVGRNLSGESRERAPDGSFGPSDAVRTRGGSRAPGSAPRTGQGAFCTREPRARPTRRGWSPSSTTRRGARGRSESPSHVSTKRSSGGGRGAPIEPHAAREVVCESGTTRLCPPSAPSAALTRRRAPGG